MKWIEYTTIAILILGLSLTEFHTYIYRTWSFTAKLIYDNWLNKECKEKVGFLYFLYEIEPIIKNIIWTILFAIWANFNSKRVRNVLIIFVLYYLTQIVFYLSYRNTSLFNNLIGYIYMGLLVAVVCIPDKKGAKVVKIKEYYF